MGENQCQWHSGVEARVTNLEQWRQQHDDNVHKEMRDDINAIRNRLPVWATFVISGLAAGFGFFAAKVFGG